MRQKTKRKKGSRRKGKLLMTVGALMILSAAVLAFNNSLEDRKARSFSDSAVEQIRKALDEENVVPSKNDGGEKYITIDGYDYIGYIEIPSLELSLPVMAEWDYERLEIAPCRYYGRVATNDLVIAWHNYVSGFGRFGRLSVGDDVIFTDAEDKKYCYAVGNIEILNPEDVEQMIENEWDLTLYTCTYGGAQRITVRCALKDYI